MIIRHTLAVIDYNSNISRKQKVSKDGQGMFKKKVNPARFGSKDFRTCFFQVDRTGTKATVVEQKVVKNRTYQENILQLCVQCLETGLVLTPKVKTTVEKTWLDILCKENK